MNQEKKKGLKLDKYIINVSTKEKEEVLKHFTKMPIPVIGTFKIAKKGIKLERITFGPEINKEKKSDTKS